VHFNFFAEQTGRQGAVRVGALFFAVSKLCGPFSLHFSKLVFLFCSHISSAHFAFAVFEFGTFFQLLPTPVHVLHVGRFEPILPNFQVLVHFFFPTFRSEYFLEFLLSIFLALPSKIFVAAHVAHRRTFCKECCNL